MPYGLGTWETTAVLNYEGRQNQETKSGGNGPRTSNLEPRSALTSTRRIIKDPNYNDSVG